MPHSISAPIAAPETAPHTEEFLLLHPTTLWREVGALLGLAAILALLRLDVLTAPASGCLGGFSGDTGLYVWLVQSNIRDLFALPWFNTNAFFPYTRTLAWSDNFILPSLLLAPILTAGTPLVLAWNGLILGAQLLNGYAMWRLAFALTGRLVPALFAATAILSSHWLSYNIGHPQLQFLFPLPLGLLLFLHWVRRPRLLTAVALGGMVSIAFLIAVYYALFLVVMVAVTLGALLCLRPRHFSPRTLGTFLLGTGLGAVPLIPFILPYLDVRATFGAREIYEAYYFAASILSYLSAPPPSHLYGWSGGLSHPEAHLFPGVLVLLTAGFALFRLGDAEPLRRSALITAGLFLLTALTSIPDLPDPAGKYACAVAAWLTLIAAARHLHLLGALERQLNFEVLSNRAIIGMLLAVALVFFLLSLGPLGNPAKGQLALGPFRLAYEIMPGFESLRAIGRAGVVVLLALTLTAALGLTRLLNHRPRLARAAWLLLPLLAAEQLIIPLGREDPPATSELAVIIRTESRPGEVALALPLISRSLDRNRVSSWGDFAAVNTRYMHYLHGTGVSFMNGYSGQRTKIMREWPGELRGFPDHRSIARLASIPGLRFILYASKEDPGFVREEFLAKVKAFGETLTLVASDPAGNHLLEFRPESRLQEDLYLLVPSFPAGTLAVELKALYENGSPEVLVDVLLPDHQTGPIATITLTAAGTWERFSVPIPPTTDRVRPLRLLLTPRREHRVFMRRPLFTAGR